MKNNIIQINALGILLFCFSCSEETIAPPDLVPSFTIAVSAAEITVGDFIEISIKVENAEELFAISFELKYSPDILGIADTATTVIEGNLFNNLWLPFQTEFFSNGEISIAIGEMGSVNSIVSGTACTISLIAENSGIAELSLHSLEMIQSDGSDITDFNLIEVESVQVEVSE